MSILFLRRGSFNLTDEQKKVASQAFDDVDDKKTGCIKNTRAALMEAVQLTGLNPTQREVDYIWTHELGESITKDQFLDLVSKFEWREPNEMKEQLKTDFEMFDTEGIGVIEAEDLVHILSNEGSNRIDEMLAGEIVKTFDKDENGQINIEQLIEKLLAPRPHIETVI